MDMRAIMALIESGRDGHLAPTEANIAAAKAFVLSKWRERAQERGHSVPGDLSSACKFASLFAARVFGGVVLGNFFHQWAQLPDGRTLDLAEDAADVATLRSGAVPDYARDYAVAMVRKPPPELYTHDQKHMTSRDNRESMASVEPRVAAWVREFIQTTQP